MGLWNNVAGVVAAPFTGGASLLATDPGQKAGQDVIQHAGGFLRGNPSQSNPTQIPGIFDRPEAQGYARRAIDMTGQGFDTGGMFQNYLNMNSQNPYNAPLQQSIMNPNYAPTSDAQKALVNQAYSGRQAQFNNLGIGDSPAAQSAIAAAGAGTLENLHQNQVSNLFGAAGQYNQNSQGQMSSVLDYLGKQLQSRGLDINTLMQGADLGKITPGGAQQTGASKGLLDYVNVKAGPMSFGGGGG